MIGHTQPRRIAARTVAERIAEETGTELGAASDQSGPRGSARRPGPVVGYQVRFTERAGEDTLVKVMTDGILLAELTRDRLLSRYDTIIVDEAHERSLNVDFILGYLKQLLPRRPDLKVIITSATIDPQRFSRHFDGAPVIEVSGRTYPVEVHYRPVNDPDDPDADDRDQTDAICDAVTELRAEAPGDVLVFLSGEREIRDTADALRRMSLPGTEILPLYARLSAAEQHRVFQPHHGRRIVLATNVAETSLTVPGIRYVVDPGTARISRYSHRTKVQRLPIEPVSQASANQRKGRCGRTADGICVRLYSQEDFEARPEFTDPEILRTNLASVILQMTALGLGDMAAFPFIEPPDRRNVSAGVQLLEELGALESSRLTPLGRKLADIPVDPRLARMILAAEDNGCVHEVMVIAAALSIQDPRERPADRQQAADTAHARFADKDSDFQAYLNLWNHLVEQQKALSSSQFRKLCRTEFLNYLRVREWQDLYGQLRQIVRPGPPAPEADPLKVHTALLAGLLSHVGLKDPAKQEYLGARGTRFGIFPGSVLFRKQPRWVVAAELVETSRLWGRIAARIEPEWVEPLAGHLVKRQYSEPHWEAKQGAVMASERVTLYGVPLIVGRKVNYGRIDPALSRELFIRHALVDGDWRTHHAFFQHNRELLDDVEDLEHRARRRDIVVDDETLFDFYDRRVPPDVVSARHFDAWWKVARRDDPDLLTFDPQMLVNAGAGRVDPRDFPDEWRRGELRLPLAYRFEPGAAGDGVTVQVPLALLSRVTADEFSWQVPGLRHELVTTLIRSLPKALRRNFVPAPDVAADVVTHLGGPPADGTGSLLDAVEAELAHLTGVRVPREAWQLDRLPDHLRMAVRVVDDDGSTLAEGRDLAVLRAELQPMLRAELATVAEGLERHGLRTWDLDPLPRSVERVRSGHRVTAYPALVDEGDSAGVRVFETEAEQHAAMWAGSRRLLLTTVASPVALVNARLSNEAKLALSRNPHRNAADLLDDCLTGAVDSLMAEAGGPLDVVTRVQRVLAAAYQVERRLSGFTSPATAAALGDVRAQLSGLVHRGFVTETGWERLADLPRYLAAIERRLDKLPENPGRDRERMLAVQEIEREYRELPPGPQATEIRWMIEELRVNYFAQALGTPYPISDKRMRVEALTRIDLDIVSDRAHHAPDSPERLARNLPYELVVVANNPPD